MIFRTARNVAYVCRLVETKHKDNVLKFPDGSIKRVAPFMLNPDGTRAAPRHHPIIVLLARLAMMFVVAWIVVLL